MNIKLVMKNSRLGSIYIIVIHYIVAAGLGGLVYKMLGGMHPYWAMFVADAVATIYIWLLGLVYKNVSFYDPYWSVAPPVFLTLWGWGSATGPECKRIRAFARKIR